MAHCARAARDVLFLPTRAGEAETTERRHHDTTTRRHDDANSGWAGGSRDVRGADEGWTNSAGLGGGLGAARACEPTAAALLPSAEGAVTTAVAALGHLARASALVLRRRNISRCAAAQHLEVRGDAPIPSVRSL